MADAIAQGKTAGVFTGKPRGKAIVTGAAAGHARERSAYPDAYPRFATDRNATKILDFAGAAGVD